VKSHRKQLRAEKKGDDSLGGGTSSRPAIKQRTPEVLKKKDETAEPHGKLELSVAGPRDTGLRGGQRGKGVKEYHQGMLQNISGGREETKILLCRGSYKERGIIRGVDG